MLFDIHSSHLYCKSYYIACFASKCWRYKDVYIDYNPIIYIKAQDFELFTWQMINLLFTLKTKSLRSKSKINTNNNRILSPYKKKHDQ